MTGNRSTAHGGAAGPVLEAATAVIQELAKTALLLAGLMLTLWGLLELFGGAAAGEQWHERLLHTFAAARLNVDGLPIGPRFLEAARRSLSIVLSAAAALGVGAMALGYAFALWPWLSVWRLPLSVVSAVPAFMFQYLGAPEDSVWFWPTLSLAIGDLNAAAMTAHCYDGIRRELNRPYVRTALAQGLSVWSDLWPRATLITLEGIRARIPHLLGGTVAIEYAFNIHGIGTMAWQAVVASRPDTNVLVWIAGLGIVATRSLSLLHRLARLVLTPERGKSAAWSGDAAGTGLLALWHAAGSGRRAPSGQGPKIGSERSEGSGSEPEWLSAVEPHAELLAPTATQRWRRRARAIWGASVQNRVKVLLAAVVAAMFVALVASVLVGSRADWQRRLTFETNEPFLPASRQHLLGTNEAGEDVFISLAAGGKELILPVAIAVAAAVLLGGLFGTLSGLALGSAADLAIDIYAELWESVPKIVLVLALLTYMSFASYSLKLYSLIGVAFAPLLVRAVRDEVGALRTSLFLEASVALGVSRWRIVWSHVLRRHVLPVLCLQGAVMAGYVLLFDAILGYCRIRQYGEVRTWGSLLGTGLDQLPEYVRAEIPTNSLVVWGPFAATVLAITFSQVVGDALKAMGRSVRFSQ